jgi:hypothetical protein
MTIVSTIENIRYVGSIADGLAEAVSSTDDSQDSHFNDNYAFDVKYNFETNSINLVAKRKERDNDLSEEKDLRSENVPFELVVVDSVNYTNKDFPEKDLTMSLIEFDVTSEKFRITDILTLPDVKKIGPVRATMQRFSKDLIYICGVQCHEKFDLAKSLVTFRTTHNMTVLNSEQELTVLEVPHLSEEGTPYQNVELHRQYTIKYMFHQIGFEIDGVDAEAWFPNYNFGHSNCNETNGRQNNAFKTPLAAGQTHTVKIKCAKTSNKEIANKYDVVLTNGFCNRSRVELRDGSEINIQLDFTGLQAGEITKLKLNLGDMTSYAELYITLV